MKLINNQINFLLQEENYRPQYDPIEVPILTYSFFYYHIKNYLHKLFTYPSDWEIAHRRINSKFK